MRGFQRTLLLAAALLLAAGPVLASGFNIYEAGAKATALGGAFTATADDGSALFYNPAGMAFFERSGFDLNLMPVMPSAEFTGATIGTNAPATGKTIDQTFPIPGVYAWRVAGDFTYGVGLYAPFGLGVEWDDPDNWAGRALSYDVDLQTVYISPAVAWKVHEDVGLSFGLDIAHTSITLDRRSLQPYGNAVTELDVIDAHIDGDSKFNFTPSLGVLIKASDKLSFGAMYHHEKKMAIREGVMTLTNIAQEGTSVHASVENLINNVIGGTEHEGEAELKLPHILALGAAYQLTQKVRCELNLVHFGWSHFDELVLDFGNEYLDSTIEEDYEDIWQIRCGVSLDVNEKLTLMGGYVYDETPQPVESMSPLLPDGTRHDFSGGLAYVLSDKITLTGTYMSVNFDERSNVVDGEFLSFDPETSPAGTYDSFAHIFGLGFGYRF